jgi:hypothetical protein
MTERSEGIVLMRSIMSIIVSLKKAKYEVFTNLDSRTNFINYFTTI